MEYFYKKLEDGIPTGNLEIRDNLKYIYPNIDLNNAEDLAEIGYCKYQHTPEPTDNHNATKKYVSSDVEISDGVWKNTWSLEDVDLTAEQIEKNNEVGFRLLRADRDFYLRRTDHWGLEDTPEMTDEMKAYREALRDLPSNTIDPWNIEWPSDPTDPDGTKY